MGRSNDAKLRSHLEDVSSHVGHRVRYYSQGHRHHVGVVLRVSLRKDIRAVVVWLEGKPFPTQIFSDQLVSCECQETRGT